MKTVNTVKYVCDYCNSNYDTIDEAKNCEDSHCKNFKLDLSQRMIYGKNAKFPSFIYLEADNGKKATYSIYSQPSE